MGAQRIMKCGFHRCLDVRALRNFGKVHTGFHSRYNQVAEEPRTWIRPGTTVLVAGAFVGSAMASLAYANWLSDKKMNLGLTFGVTFGAPQVGDKKAPEGYS